MLANKYKYAIFLITFIASAFTWEVANGAVLLQGGTDASVECFMDGGRCGQFMGDVTRYATISGNAKFLEVYVYTLNANTSNGLVFSLRQQTGAGGSFDPEMAHFSVATTSLVANSYNLIPLDSVADYISATSSYGYYLEGYQAGYPAVSVGSNAVCNLGGGGCEIWYRVLDAEGDPNQPNNINTRIISTYPLNGTTTATTTLTGAVAYVNKNDSPNESVRLHIKFWQDSAIACRNSTALIDAFNCKGSAEPSFSVDFNGVTELWAFSATKDLSTSTTFKGGGKWHGTYELQKVNKNLFWFDTYETIYSTTTDFVIGQLSEIDIARGEIASSSEARSKIINKGIGAALASSTIALADVCSPIATSTNLFGLTYNVNFDPVGCGVMLVIPSERDIEYDLNTLKSLAPWGYVFRVYDIMTATTSTTTLPVISYTFATSSPFYSVGAITFDINSYLAQSASLINEMKSDRAQPLTVWDILMPIVKTVVYLILFFKIVSDIMGIDLEGGYSGYMDKKRGFKHVTDEQYRYKEQLYKMSQRK